MAHTTERMGEDGWNKKAFFIGISDEGSIDGKAEKLCQYTKWVVEQVKHTLV